MRRRIGLALATMIATAGLAGATENVVTRVSARAEGGKTVITVRGSATPSFTAYRLERPARVVVDLADGKLGADELRSGPIDVDTWAVGQIAMAQYADDATRTARVMIGFKRPSTYDVKAVGHDLVIIITPDEPMPADALQADAGKLDEARKRRLEAEAQVAATEERQKRAERAEAEAHGRAGDAEREADAARARAKAAKDELDRMVAARKLEEQRLAEVQKRASSTGAQLREQEQQAQQAKLEQSRLTGEQQQLQQQLASLRAEAQKLAQARDAEAKKLTETQAAARQAAEEKQARLEQLEQTARARQQASEAARLAEERKAQARVDEATRLAQAAAQAAQERAQAVEARAQAEQARASEAASRANEAASRASEAASQKTAASREASREAENRARVAQARAQAAEQAARVEQQKLQALRAEAQKQADAARGVADEVTRARGELDKLYAAQQAERARVEAARRDAAALAAQRAQELERAQHAAALASGSLEKIAKAEREARRIADERAQESARLDAIKKELQAADEARAGELKRLEAARGEAAKLMAARDAELKRLEAARKQEEQRLAEVRGEEQQAAAELSATRDRQRAASHELDETRKSREQQAAALAETRRSQAEAARELDETRKSRAEQAAALEETRRSRAEQAAALEETRRSRAEQAAALEETRRSQAALQAQQAAIKAQLAEQQRAFDDEQKRQAAERAAAQARIDAARREAARAKDELRKLDAERQTAAAQARAAAAQAAEATRDAQSSAAERERLAAERARIDHEQQQLEAQLTVERAQVTRKLQAAQQDLQRMLADQAKQKAEREKLDSERKTLEQQLQKARAELARVEQATRERLSLIPTPAKQAELARDEARKPAARSKDALPVDKLQARVRDVRFSDDDDAERVILDVAGAADADVVRSDARGAVLKLSRAELPKKLERTLDATAFKGPIKSVSTYADADDPGAVRVEVALADGEHAPPRLVRDDGKLTWEFPRVRSLPPTKVAPYGASLPLQAASAMPTMSRPAANNRRRSYTGKRMTFDFTNADIHNVLKLIADVAQVNIVAAEDVKGTVTITLRDVPWDQALDVILKAKGLGMQREGNLIRVAPQAVLEKELEQELARQKAAVELKPVETRLIGLSYADGQQMLPRVQELLSSRGRASIDQRTNMLIITDVPGNIALAEDLVRNLDTQTPQVSIEARIVEANTTFTRDIGIQWGGNTINSVATGNPTGIAFPSTVGAAGGAVDNATNVQGLQLGQSGAASPNYVVNMPAAVGTGSGGALGLTLGSVNGTVNINLRLSALENTGNVKIISAPKITTLDNIEAHIEQGVSIPISVVSAAGTNTLFVDAKLNLTVKPHVTNEGSVLMNVQVTRNEPDFVNTGARGDPTILKKAAATQMLVRDGDTAVIGGIFTRNTGLSYTKVPWFADIPVIGWLFKNRRENDDRTELLIFITPRIINRPVVAR